MAINFTDVNYSGIAQRNNFVYRDTDFFNYNYDTIITFSYLSMVFSFLISYLVLNKSIKLNKNNYVMFYFSYLFNFIVNTSLIIDSLSKGSYIWLGVTISILMLVFTYQNTIYIINIAKAYKTIQ